MTKTNAMRLLEKAGIPFRTAEYEVDESDLSGVHAAEVTGQDPGTMFKTLVLKGDKSGFFVCCIPVNRELDLKKAAKVSGNKKCEMLHVKDLLGVTGYIRGGCSPVGMKKKFPTYMDISVGNHEEISVSAGVRGMQIITEPHRLCEYIDAKMTDITVDN
ncbi:MAG: Cys-tRNA(Pro) deacylase [Oscillospiraceae bacterium]|nr:Cys-tRNA(Pro) deacylase [Oscillospiraceae bacterium]